MSILKLALLITLFTLQLQIVTGQCMIEPLSLNQKVTNSHIIIEGRIVESAVFKTETDIYTEYTIHPYKVFKGGDILDGDLIIKQLGGNYLNEILTVSYNPSFKKGDLGIFFLTQVGNHFKVYGAKQGFMDFNSSDNNTYYYNQIIKKTSQDYIILDNLDVVSKTSRLKGQEVIDFSPKVLSAGTNQLLTIYGSGFGKNRNGGYVSFFDADNGGNGLVDIKVKAAYNHWSDTMIIMNVFARRNATPGTGIITVTNGIGNQYTSSQEIIIESVRYQHIAEQKIRHFELVNMNNEGGYTFYFNDKIDNDQMKNVFFNVLETVSCSTGISYTLSETPSIINSNEHDGTNIIRYANPEELPAGVLGGSIFRTVEADYSGEDSSHGTKVTYIDEIDFIFNKEVPWNYSASLPQSNEYDFESTVLHEILHTLGIGHVIKNDDVMHFSVGTGVTHREVSAPIIEVCDLIRNENGIGEISAYPPMTFKEVGYCLQTYSEESIKYIKVFPNPINTHSEKLTISTSGLSDKTIIVTLYDQLSSVVFTKAVPANIDLNVDLSSLSNGVYFLKVNESTLSIVVEND